MPADAKGADSFKIKPYKYLGDTQPFEWRWYGGICYRDNPSQEDLRHHYYAVPLSQSLDACMADFDSGEAWPNRRVGALGFLLSCKHGYFESLPIIYATNTILLEYHPFILGLLRQDQIPSTPRLIGPGFHLITSLFLRTSFSLWYRAFEDEERTQFHKWLRLLPGAFPNLCRLEWALGPNVVVPDGRQTETLVGEFEDILLRPLLRMSDEIGALGEMLVAVNIGLFFRLAELEGQRTIRGREYMVGEGEKHLARLWYPFDKVPGEEREVNKGFWIAFGSDIWIRGKPHQLVREWEPRVGVNIGSGSREEARWKLTY
ncbi:hypothetical protein N0V88_007075 [Collariella sp. IMI 366227]|nr:hypothetical protein N0V88_007075 [Collariella sp. IMI 366227]